MATVQIDEKWITLNEGGLAEIEVPEPHRHVHNAHVEPGPAEISTVRANAGGSTHLVIAFGTPGQRVLVRWRVVKVRS